MVMKAMSNDGAIYLYPGMPKQIMVNYVPKICYDHITGQKKLLRSGHRTQRWVLNVVKGII
jgi:hypothetical protein